MNPEANKTLYALENLEHEVSCLIQDTMYRILDNGDSPDKRIDAIIGLHYATIGIHNRLSKLERSIPESK
jgi:hypothetical protein